MDWLILSDAQMANVQGQAIPAELIGKVGLPTEAET
jgi:hypothetical protein